MQKSRVSPVPKFIFLLYSSPFLLKFSSTFNKFLTLYPKKCQSSLAKHWPLKKLVVPCSFMCFVFDSCALKNQSFFFLDKIITLPLQELHHYTNYQLWGSHFFLIFDEAMD